MNDKELELRKQMGDKAYYKKKLEDDRMTLKILRILGIIIVLTSVIIVALSAEVGQYSFTIGWSVTAVVLLVSGGIYWHKLAKRREIYLEAYNKNEIQKEKIKKIEEKHAKDVKVIKPKR